MHFPGLTCNIFAIKSFSALYGSNSVTSRTVDKALKKYSIVIEFKIKC